MANGKNLVSVIIPNYNHHRYLKERIQSILDQEYSNYEIIILDDCSSDNSIEVIERFRTNSKVSHICMNEKNSGSTFKQWEKGIKLAKGEYIWIAESDDSADPQLLSTIMKGLFECPSAVLSFCNSSLIDSNGDTLDGEPDYDDYCTSFYSVHHGINFIYDKMLYHNRIYNASAVVFKKEIWEMVSKEFTQYRFCGDWVFWMEAMSCGDIVWVHKKYNKFRKHLNKVSPKADVEGMDFQERHRMVAFVKRHFHLSYIRMVSVLGNIYMNLICSRVISSNARKRELKNWLKEYPFIVFYVLFRLMQLLPRRIGSKLGIMHKYKSPHTILSYS